MTNLRNLLITCAVLLSTQAFAWSAIFLGGQNWAIICADGTASSYTGSSAGLDTVGPAECPGGVIDISLNVISLNAISLNTIEGAISFPVDNLVPTETEAVKATDYNSSRSNKNAKH